MNVEKIFKACADIEPFDQECRKLLDKVMSVSSPMKFDDEFATDAELDRLEAELDRFNRRSRESDTLRITVEGLPAYQTNSFVFI